MVGVGLIGMGGAGYMGTGPVDTIGHLLGNANRGLQSPSTPIVTRVSKASRTVRRSSGVADHPVTHMLT